MISVRWNDFSAYFSPAVRCSGLYSLSVFLSVEKVRFSFRFCKRKEPCGDVVSEDAAELKIVWLKEIYRLAQGGGELSIFGAGNARPAADGKALSTL